MRAHCRRCDHEVEGVYQHPKMRLVARAYLFMWVPFLPIIPIMASDYVVSLPILMFYMLGIGPILTIIQDPPTCSECGAVVVPPGKAAMPS